VNWPETIGTIVGSAIGGAVLALSGKSVVDRLRARLKGVAPPPKR
jgi:hypothetical protein